MMLWRNCFTASRKGRFLFSATKRSNQPGPLVCSVTIVSAVALHTVADWTEDERSWSMLVARIAEGNERALGEFYDVTQRIVYGLALRILSDSFAAEEVTLEVYLQVWRTAASYDPERGKVVSWLISLTRSRAIDALRARRARRAQLEHSLHEVPDPRDLRHEPEQISIQASRRYVIQKAMAELPSEQRYAIELAYFSGLTHAEIASHTGSPLGTVKTRIRLGMVRLREMLALHSEAL
jgi:RNA polymerase sigma-70 factor, ECF subfamily